METVKEILMRRDGNTEEEAQARIDEAQEEMDRILTDNGTLSQAERVIYDHFGLEPDYLMEFLEDI